MKNKLFSILISAIMLVTMIPATAFAEWQTKTMLDIINTNPDFPREDDVIRESWVNENDFEMYLSNEEQLNFKKENIVTGYFTDNLGEETSGDSELDTTWKFCSNSMYFVLGQGILEKIQINNKFFTDTEIGIWFEDFPKIIGEYVAPMYWAQLQKCIDDYNTNYECDAFRTSSADGILNITILTDIRALSTDKALTIPSGKKVILNLDGHVLDRMLISSDASAKDSDDSGSVIEVNGGELTVRDGRRGIKHNGYLDDKFGLWHLANSSDATTETQGGYITGGTTGIKVNSGTLNIKGGTIAGNAIQTSGSKGAGIYCGRNATVNIGGNTVVQNNINKGKTTGSFADNLFIENGSTVNILTSGDAAPTERMKIGVTTEQNGGLIASSNINYADKFIPDESSWLTVYENNIIRVLYKACSINGKIFDSLNTAIANVASGDTITLLNDNNEIATVSKEISFKIDASGNSYNASNIKAGSGYKVETTGDAAYVMTYTFTKSSGGGGGGGGSGGGGGGEEPESKTTDAEPVVTYDSRESTLNVTIEGLTEGIDYKVNLPEDGDKVGTHTAEIVFTGDYSKMESKIVTYVVNPKGTEIKKLSPRKKAIKLTLAKQTKQTTGYQIRYSLKSNMKSAKTVTIAKNKTTTKTIKNLKSKKKYYVQIRTYKNVKENKKTVKYCSNWSKAKTVKTK